MQAPPRTWAFTLNVLEGEKPDEYIVYPNDVLPSLQLHEEKLNAWVESTDGRNLRRRLTRDSTIRLPAAYSSVAIQWAGFRLDYDSLPSGMYTLSATAEPGFATRTDGSLEPLHVADASSMTIYVPPPPDRVPEPGIGERFIFQSHFGYNREQAVRISDEHGVPLPFDQVAARLLTYTGTISSSSGEAGVHFDRSGGKHLGVTFLGFSDPKDVPGLYPVIEDRVSKQMNAEYGEHRVWTRGTPDVFCDACHEYMPPNSALFVVGVYRARGYAEDMAIRQDGRNLAQPSSFRALDPRIVALRDRGSFGPHSHMLPLSDSGPNAYATFSDDWDLERNLSLVSMEQSHPDWSTSVRNAIVAVKPKLGMTRDMVAWMLGYPSTYGTIAQLNRLDTWIYDGPPSTDIGFNFSFDFQTDRVTKCFPECTSRL